MASRRTTHPASPAASVGSRHAEAGASPGFVLWQVTVVWQRLVRTALDDVGLTHAQFVMLASAAWLEAQHKAGSGETVTQSLVAAHARTDAVMTSEVLRTLEGKALVRRVPHPTDARAKQISVTPEGRRIAKRAMALVEAVDDEFFSAGGPELSALKRLLR
jgi:MarR family transcriptional regulator, organic hydroperoxide resistance regulator